MSLSCIEPDLLGSFNEFLSGCDLPFTLVCVGLEGQWLTDLKEFVAVPRPPGQKCHQVFGVPDVPYALVALDKGDNTIASYLSFSASDGSPGPEKWCSKYLPMRAISLEFSCTGKDYYRRGLSKLLRLVTIGYAIKHGYEEVVSSTNEISGHILSKYFGFEIADTTNFMRENCAFKFSLEVNARLLLDQSHLEKYHQTYRSMTDCQLVS